MITDYEEIIEQNLFKKIEEFFINKFHKYFGHLLFVQAKYDENIGVLYSSIEFSKIDIDEEKMEEDLKKDIAEGIKNVKFYLDELKNPFEQLDNKFELKISENLRKLNSGEKFAYLTRLIHDLEKHNPDDRINYLKIECFSSDRCYLDYFLVKDLFSRNATKNDIAKNYTKGSFVLCEEGFNKIFKYYKNFYFKIQEFIHETYQKYDKGLLTNQTPDEIANLKLEFRPIFNINEDIKLSKYPNREIYKVLDKYQTALLFHYIMAKGIILDFNDKSLAKLISIMTPHSEQNIRTECLAYINQIIKDKTKDKNHPEPNYNLNCVRRALQEIIEDIDREIQSSK